MHDCVLHQPKSLDTRVWRYMRFAKLVLLFETGRLFFPFTSKFEDALEGGGTAAEPRSAPVSSWHISDHESQAMWRLYSPMQEAIAKLHLRAPATRPAKTDPPSARCGNLDRMDPACVHSNALYPFFVKRTAFEHEKELRAVVTGPIEDAAGDGLSGYGIPVDLGTLLEKVVISPTAPEWFADLVFRLGRRYRIEAPIERSALTGTLRSR